jgi:CRP-like cAMP-binding protein
MPSANQILARLPADEYQQVNDIAEPFVFPVEHTVAQPGDPYDAIYFPETGLLSLVNTTETGHNVEIATVGADGVLGAAALLLGIDASPYQVVASVAATGHRLPADAFRRLRRQLPTFEALTLGYIGQMLVGMGRAMACNRFHSVRERAAKWLLVATGKTGRTRMSLTHDFLAQLIGGPRHAVTAAMNELRTASAIRYERGEVEIVDATALAALACECHLNSFVVIRPPS